jgi:hypothetical protein
MRYRKLDANGDMVFGNDQASFYVNQPEAPAQAVMTRLNMFQGEWFLDRTAGTPWNTQVLGNRTASTRDQVIKARTLGTQGVSGIASYSSDLDRRTRVFSVSEAIDTIYGAAQTVANAWLVRYAQDRLVLLQTDSGAAVTAEGGAQLIAALPGPPNVPLQRAHQIQQLTTQDGQNLTTQGGDPLIGN